MTYKKKQDVEYKSETTVTYNSDNSSQIYGVCNRTCITRNNCTCREYK